MKKRKKISLLLAVVLLANLMYGCSPGGSSGNGKVREYTISEEEPLIEGEGLKIAFSPYDVNAETKVSVQQIEPPNLFSEEVTPEEVKVTAYDIKATEITEFTDIIEIRIPFDQSFIESGSPEKNVGAMYYDEELGEWTPVPFEIDKESSEVVITANHLSVYSAYTIKNENSRTAQIISVNSFPMLPPGTTEAFEEVIEEAMSSQMTPGKKAMELGLGITGDWMNISGAALTTITQTMYVSEFAEGLGSAFSNVGLAGAFVQAAYDFSRGDDTALFNNLTKNISYFSVSRWGTNALNLAFVGVYAIDYSLNKFATEAWDGRSEIWYEAYKEYYKKENSRKYKEWYNRFYQIWQENKDSKDPNAVSNKINQAIDEYTNAFWNLPEEDQAFWQSEIQKTGFSGGGGLNELLKEEISAAAKVELIAVMQETVFYRLEQKITAQLMEDYRKELINIKNYLNKRVDVLITENVKENETAEYAGYTVRFAPLGENANKANWTGKIKEDGTLRTVLTPLGHIQSGAPDKLLLFEPSSDPDTDEPIKEIPFRISFPETRINLKESKPTMDEISGSWSEVHMDFPNPPVVEETAEESECDINAAIAEMIRIAKLSCSFNIQKIDEENATLVFGVKSGVNKETGESLDVEPSDPLSGPSTYKDGVFTSKIDVEGSSIEMKLNMKKTPEGEITFEGNGVMTIVNEGNTTGTIDIRMVGKK